MRPSLQHSVREALERPWVLLESLADTLAQDAGAGA